MQFMIRLFGYLWLTNNEITDETCNLIHPGSDNAEFLLSQRSDKKQ
jgi:hypothetical protein